MGERQYRRVAVLSDVHGNAVALQAVLAELAETDAELVVFGGDLTWGPLPERTLELVHEISLPKLFVAGNAERGNSRSRRRAHRTCEVDAGAHE